MTPPARIDGRDGGTALERDETRPRSALASTGLAAVALACLLAGCDGPFFMFPGGRLSGVEAAPPADWSAFASGIFELETRPSDPYSVELNYIVKDGKLYVDPAEGRRWLDHMRADPHVRVRFVDEVYPLRAVRVTDPAELEGFDPERIVYRLDPR